MGAGEASGDVYKAFFKAMACGGVESIARAAYGLLQKPLVIGDDAGTVLAQLPDKDMDLRIWSHLHAFGTTDQASYLELYKDMAAHPIEYNRPVLVKDRFLVDGYQVVIAVRYHGDMIAFVSMTYGHEQPTDRDWSIIRVFSEAVCPELVRFCVGQKTHEERLSAILGDADAHSTSYRVALEALRKKYAGPFRMLCAQLRKPSDEGLAESLLAKVAHELNSGLFDCLAVTSGQSLRVLVHGLLEGGRMLEGVQDVLRNSGLQVGVSMAFDDVAESADMLFQAQMTLESGCRLHPEEAIYDCEELLPYQVFAAASHSCDLGLFVDPTVRRIATYDRDHDSDYLDTLAAYYSNYRNKADAANELHVHVNTLKYRLGRIEELFDVTLDDYSFVPRFFSSFMIIRIKG